MSVLPRLLLVPPLGWQEKIQKVIDNPKPIYLKVGSKRSSYRRRLVTASVQPSFYNNFNNNKLKLFGQDSADLKNFMELMKQRDPKDPSRRLLYGFFHPYANNGGGGEKVLWQAVEATLQLDDRNIAVIYTTNIDAQPKDILNKAAQKFNIKDLDASRVVFIYLRKFSALIDAAYWNHFTLIGQLFGSMLLGLEAMYELSPDIWIDTIGLPGTYWLVRWALKIPIVAYVHYPIIQPDMFNKLKFRTFLDLRHTKPNIHDLKHALQFLYWKMLAALYAYLGSCVDLTLANGTWTFDHITNVWYANRQESISILYPPCSTETFVLPESTVERENKLLYIAQFRPEKRHSLILDEFLLFLNKLRNCKVPISEWPKVVFLGSCKSKGDSFTLDSLREQVEEKNLSEHVEFIVDCPFSEVQRALRTCTFGLNAMWNEHFGIGVVEYASSGVVPIVHASAGPLLDILSVGGPSFEWKNDVGFFFKSDLDPDFKGIKKDSFLEFDIQDKSALYPTLSQLLGMIYIDDPPIISPGNLDVMRKVGANYVKEKFSNQAFNKQWSNKMKVLAALEAVYRMEKRDKVCAVY